jgi:hypothetical protein
MQQKADELEVLIVQASHAGKKSEREAPQDRSRTVTLSQCSPVMGRGLKPVGQARQAFSSGLSCKSPSS